MKRYMRWAGLLCSVAFPALAIADTDRAPFKVGEVVVIGHATDFSGYSVKRHFPEAAITVLNVGEGNEQRAIQALTQRGVLAYHNRVAEKFAVNDPYAGYQWHFNTVQAPQAWTLATGAGVVVAVLDTGLNTAGPDGINCVTAAKDMVGSVNGVTDVQGHGTHVSGTIAQKTDNGVGVAGLAYGSCVMPVKVLDDTGSGTFADIAAGIHYAVDNGARVINMSLGVSARFGLTNDPVMDPALDYANQAGVTVVVAAGNDGFRKNVSYPAIYPTTIAVGATGYNNALASYSNYGKGLDVVAPGGNLSADQNNDGYADGVLQETFDSNGFGYWFYQGTSMASPHVAAIAALLISHGNATTPDEVRAALQDTALDLGSAGKDTKYGYGLVQAYNALQWVAGVTVPPSGGSCTDLDGDGVCAEAGDCDDNDPQVYPGFNEKGRRSFDGKDNDCNGIIDG